MLIETSATFDRRAVRMQRVDVGLLAREAAVVIADRLVEPLQQAARAAGGSEEMVSAIETHDGHLNDLVMLERGDKGDVIVGVGGESPYAEEAQVLEWGGRMLEAVAVRGNALALAQETQSPKAWVRMTAARRGRDVTTMWSNELTRELDRRCS